MRNTLETRLGIFFALALFVSVLILEMVGAFDFFKRGYEITAGFRNVQELKKGDMVKMAGVEIGRVQAIELTRTTNNVAVVRMKIQIKYTNSIPTDSKAVIRFTGLMGQNYIAIEPGQTNVFSLDGGSLEATEQPDLSGLMAKLQDVADGVQGLTKSFSPNSLSTLLGPILQFVERETNNLSATVANILTVSSNLATSRGTVGKLINDDALYRSASTVVSNAETASTDIQGLVRDASAMVNSARLVIADVNAGRGNLGLIVRDDALYRQTTNAMRHVGEILQKVNQGTGSVSRLINDEALIKNAKMSLQKLDKATESLEDQGPLSVLGIVIGTLF